LKEGARKGHGHKKGRRLRSSASGSTA
jgi:hypothetical protein